VVGSRYTLQAEPATGKRFGFVVGDYRSDVDLVIDPGVQYATFLGGTSHEIGTGIQVDAAGNALIGVALPGFVGPTCCGGRERIQLVRSG
jgi:hypothetical protein